MLNPDFRETKYQNELYHYGIKRRSGRYPWGSGERPFQGDDLSKTQRRKIMKNFRRDYEKVRSQSNVAVSKFALDSYNRAADYMNKFGIAKYNEEQKKKYGDKYAEREGYEDDYYRLFDKKATEYYNQSLKKFYENNEYYNRVINVVSKYSIGSWDGLTQKDKDHIDNVMKIADQMNAIEVKIKDSY